MWQAAENDFYFIDAHSRSAEDVQETMTFINLQHQLQTKAAEIKPS